MRRSPVASLLCTLPAALSCAILSAPAPAPDGVGQVAAPPQAAVEDDPRPDDARVAQIRDFLSKRRTALTAEEVGQLARTIVAESRRHDMDPWLVVSVMAVESGFQNFAVSHVGAMGLMQVMPATGEELAGRLGIPWHGPQTLFDPIANVRMGVAYLRELTDRYERLPVALAAYNWGPGRIDRKLRRGVPLPQDYARLVLGAYDVNQRRRSS